MVAIAPDKPCIFLQPPVCLIRLFYTFFDNPSIPRKGSFGVSFSEDVWDLRWGQAAFLNRTGAENVHGAAYKRGPRTFMVSQRQALSAYGLCEGDKGIQSFGLVRINHSFASFIKCDHLTDSNKRNPTAGKVLDFP